MLTSHKTPKSKNEQIKDMKCGSSFPDIFLVGGIEKKSNSCVTSYELPNEHSNSLIILHIEFEYLQSPGIHSTHLIWAWLSVWIVTEQGVDSTPLHKDYKYCKFSLIAITK